MDFLSIFLGAVLVLLWLFYRKRKRGADVLKQLGIPGPEPHWLYGNFLLPKDRYLQIAKWTKQYGKTYGFYEGPKPWIISSDLDFIHEFLIKQFSCFHARQEFPIGPRKDNPGHLFDARGGAWKRLRNISNPTFTSAKLRLVSQLMRPKLDTLLVKMQTMRDTHKPVEIHDIYQKFTLDVIADVAFGITLDAQNKTEDRFLKECRKAFSDMEDRQLIFKFAAMFPEIRHCIHLFFKMVFVKLVHVSHVWLMQKFAEVVKIRRSQQVKRSDLMQLLMDAVENTETKQQLSKQSSREETQQQSKLRDDDDILTSGDLSAALGRSDMTEMINVSKTLSDHELVRMSHLFLLAGYETTSNALMYLTYLLAMNPDKQEKLVEEIQQHVQQESDVTYDLVMKLPYLDMCVMETLRMYPVATGVITRMCTSPCTIQGTYIPEGVTLHPDAWTIHHDPQYYPDPWKFEPERFSPEARSTHHPMQYMPFGLGPRNCVGMRFGLMEIKLAMVHLLRRLRFEKSEITEDPLLIKEAVTITPVNGVYVNILDRET